MDENLTQRIGVCIFLNPNAPDIGWTSVAGSDPVKIDGPHDLDSSTLWVTNLDFKAFKASHFYSIPGVKDNQFFRTSVDILLKELGFDIKNRKETTAEAARVLSRTFSHVATLGEKYFGMNVTNGNFSAYRYHVALFNSIFPRVLKDDYSSPLSSAVETAAGQATQMNQAMSGVMVPKGSSTNGFYFPRLAYGRYLLSLPLPIGTNWREVKFKSDEVELGYVEDTEIPGTQEVLAKLLTISREKAVLFRVTVHQTNKFYRPFATFGAGVRTTRTWATLPEIIELCRYSRVSIRGGYSCDIGSLNDIGFAQDFMSDIEQVDEYSFARGLLMENLWVALATKPRDQDGTMIGAYLRAYDRILCSKVAAHMARERRYIIGSYGTGRVTLYLKRAQLREAKAEALKQGLLNSIQGIE